MMREQEHAANPVRKSLGIVQTYATQFDPGLFREIAAQPDIDLTVYWRPEGGSQQVDPELGRKSGWQTDLAGYRHVQGRPGIAGLIAFIRVILAAKHDLVIVAGYFRSDSLLIAAMGRLFRRPIGIRSDSVFLYRKTETWKWKFKDRLIPLLLKLFRTGHPTGTLARDYLRRYGMRDDALFYYPYAIDDRFLLERDQAYRPSRQNLRDHLGIKPSEFVMLAVVKFVDREDPITFVKAAALLQQQGTPVRCILVGDGPLRPQIEELIRAERIEGIHLPGYVPYSELPKYYAMSDVFVHPARVEQWGVSVNEAMVLGLPVILADTVGSAPDLVGQNEAGLTYPVGEASALAERVKRMIDDPLMRCAMSRQAVTRVEEWSYRRTVRDIRDALRYVAGASDR